jgi:hypothetical protein
MSFDPLQWDLNPEGAGVQPMLCNVDLNFKFIGGSSLGGPIEQLQNAVSFNFFANTSVYNMRRLVKSKGGPLSNKGDTFGYGAFLEPGQEFSEIFDEETQTTIEKESVTESNELAQQQEKKRNSEMDQETKDAIDNEEKSEEDKEKDDVGKLTLGDVTITDGLIVRFPVKRTDSFDNSALNNDYNCRIIITDDNSLQEYVLDELLKIDATNLVENFQEESSFFLRTPEDYTSGFSEYFLDSGSYALSVEIISNIGDGEVLKTLNSNLQIITD